MKTMLEVLPLLAWAGLWMVGGWLLAAFLFRLRRAEAPMVGFGIGLVLQAWLANLLAHVLPPLPAFWLGATLIAAAGLYVARAFRTPAVRLGTALSPWLLLAALTLLFYAIGRGLAIFDDYQNLPTVSLLASGDIPPHFALNPDLHFGYHYLLLLFAAQIMRLGDLFPWSALDLGRGLVMALALILAGFLGHRLTRRRLGGVLTAGVLAFSGGARWLLLLLPSSWLHALSRKITLIGSASTTAATLSEALLSPWKIDGAGPIPFPFAFYSGINPPYVMAHSGISGLGILILLLLLLSAERWRRWEAGLLSAALLAALAVANEVAFGLILLGFLLLSLAWTLAHRSWRLPRSLWRWLGLLGGASLVALLQGGMLTEMARARLGSAAEARSYFDASPALVWPPAIISAHFGSLSLVNPAQGIVALLEIGPIILVTPLVFAWAWKSFKLGKWYEAALIAASFGSVPALFLAFKGPLFTATPRLLSGWLFACALYALPLLWSWASHNEHRAIGALFAAGMAVLPGLLLFGIQLVAVQKPLYATFITPLDAEMARAYWNRLPPRTLIFDPSVYRAPTVFGRFTRSSPSWYTLLPEWEALASSPDPFRLRAAGFEYMYFDRDYWDGLPPAVQALFRSTCVKTLAQVEGIHSEKDYRKDFRRLLDIQTCW